MLHENRSSQALQWGSPGRQLCIPSRSTRSTRCDPSPMGRCCVHSAGWSGDNSTEKARHVCRGPTGAWWRRLPRCGRAAASVGHQALIGHRVTTIGGPLAPRTTHPTCRRRRRRRCLQGGAAPPQEADGLTGWQRVGRLFSYAFARHDPTTDVRGGRHGHSCVPAPLLLLLNNSPVVSLPPSSPDA